MNPYWTNASANQKLAEIQSLPLEERLIIADQIRNDLKGFVTQHFNLAPLQEECRQALPQEYYEETGYLMARAIEKGHEIEITVTDDPTPVAAARRGDSVEGGWSEKDGFSVKYKFEF